MEELIKPKNLRIIREVPENLVVLLKEPIYTNGIMGMYESPDLLLGYQSGCWTVIELKHSMKTKAKLKAYSQIESGFEMLHDIFNVKYNFMKGKVVCYACGFEYKDYPLKRFYKIESYINS